MQRHLHLERARRVLVEHDDPLLARGAGRRHREGAGEVPQVERVLHRVEAEGLARQRAVGEPAHERMREDGCVDGLDGPPERAGRAHALASSERQAPIATR